MIANPTRQLPILIFISFDAFRYDYLSDSLTPSLFDLSRRATLGHMESLYITKTYPNHFSMVTGLYEDEHEIINNKMFDPRINKTFQSGVTSEVWWNFKGTAVPIWTANQKFGEKTGQKRYSASMMYPGSVTPYLNSLPTHLKAYNTVRNWTDNMETVISWLTHPTEPANFVSIYFDDPDSHAHTYGPMGQETLDAVRRVDSAAGYLVKRLRDVGLADKTNILFVSDHGMGEVRNVIYLSDFLDTSKFELHGNSPAWSVFIKPENRHKKNKIFFELLTASKNNHYTISKREDIPAEYHYSKTPRIGDFFLMVDENYDLFKDRPQKEEVPRKVWGNHGWKPDTPSMRPLFMAYGPSFKQGYYHEKTFPNIDLFPLMLYILELPRENYPNNGSLNHIVDIIDVRQDSGEALQLAYFIILGVMMLVLSGVLFTLFATAQKPKFKPDVEFDDLAPGLNIDLGYYLNDNQFDYKKTEDRRRKKREEMLALLNSDRNR